MEGQESAPPFPGRVILRPFPVRVLNKVVTEKITLTTLILMHFPMML